LVTVIVVFGNQIDKVVGLNLADFVVFAVKVNIFSWRCLL